MPLFYCLFPVLDHCFQFWTTVSSFGPLFPVLDPKKKGDTPFCFCLSLIHIITRLTHIQEIHIQYFEEDITTKKATNHGTISYNR